MTDLADPLGPATARTDPATGSDEPSKGERTRRRLLDLAVERFGARGYRDTSVSEIARLAGVTQAAVYAYYEGKDDLFLAAVDADGTALVDEAHAEVSGVPVRQLVAAFLLALRNGLERHPLARRVIGGQEPEVVPRLVDLPALRHFAETVAVSLREGQATGEVRSDIDPDLMVGGIESLVISLLFAMEQSGGLGTHRQRAGVVEAFDAMIRPSS